MESARTNLGFRPVFDLANGSPASGATTDERVPSERRPLLFLFDELLEGTNSKDRRIGAEGLIRALLQRQAIGMVTTHDLALTEIAEALGNSIRNVHLEDQVADDKMLFDYKLRDGVVTKSNALALMRIVGLET